MRESRVLVIVIGLLLTSVSSLPLVSAQLSDDSYSDSYDSSDNWYSDSDSRNSSKQPSRDMTASEAFILFVFIVFIFGLICYFSEKPLESVNAEGVFNGWYEQKLQNEFVGFRYKQWGNFTISKGILRGTGKDFVYDGRMLDFKISGRIYAKRISFEKTYTNVKNPSISYSIPYDGHIGNTSVGEYSYRNARDCTLKGLALLRFRGRDVPMDGAEKYWESEFAPSAPPAPDHFSADDFVQICTICKDFEVDKSIVLCRSGHTGICSACWDQRLSNHIMTQCLFCEEPLVTNIRHRKVKPES